MKQGDVMLVHSSYKAIGNTSLSPNGIIECLLECIGDTGTLLMPALSHKQSPPNLHDNSLTPSNVGVIPESFRVISTQFARCTQRILYVRWVS